MSFLFVLLAWFVAQEVDAGELVDINRADAVQIAAALDGIGQKKAEKIVAWRKEHGAFKSLDDVAKVTGIGSKLAERNKNYLQFGSKAQATKKSEQSHHQRDENEKGVLSLPIGAYPPR